MPFFIQFCNFVLFFSDEFSKFSRIYALNFQIFSFKSTRIPHSECGFSQKITAFRKPHADKCGSACSAGPGSSTYKYIRKRQTLISGVDVAAVAANQKFYHVLVAEYDRQLQRGPAFLVARIEFSAVFDEQSCDLYVVLVNRARTNEWGVTV